MAKFTSALNVLDPQIDWHITLCFCDAVKAGKFSTASHTGMATVINVEYWSHVNLTVMTVECGMAIERHEYYKSLGYTYDYDFVPHITIGSGDLTSEYIHFKGEKLKVGEEYARIY